MIARRATKDDIARVVLNLSPHSHREIFCARPENYTEAELYTEICRASAIALLEYALVPGWQERPPDNGPPPAAVFSAYRLSPAVCSFRLISTAEFPTIAGAYPRWMLRHVAPKLRAAGCHMAEFPVLADPAPNYRWFATMGAVPYGPPLPRGRNREPYQTMVVVDGEWPALTSAPQ